MAGAGAAFTAGVNAVTESPTAKAAQHLDKALANYQDAITSGRMANALNAVSLPAWKAAAVAGAGRLASGAAKGAPKMLKAVNALMPVWQEQAQAAASAPDDPVAKFSASLKVMQDAKAAGRTKGY